MKRHKFSNSWIWRKSNFNKNLFITPFDIKYIMVTQSQFTSLPISIICSLRLTTLNNRFISSLSTYFILPHHFWHYYTQFIRLLVQLNYSFVRTFLTHLKDVKYKDYRLTNVRLPSKLPLTYLNYTRKHRLL